MPNIDKSKFRFKIGDKVLYSGKKYEIIAYYFVDRFNNYRNYYGYTLKTDFDSHYGEHYFYDENGNQLFFNERNCWFVTEKQVHPTEKKIKKIKIKIN